MDSSKSTSNDGIARYWVQYGKPGYLARFGTIHERQLVRDSRVLVHTTRGIELGRVLAEVLELDQPLTGEIVRALDHHEPQTAKLPGAGYAQLITWQAAAQAALDKLPAEPTELAEPTEPADTAPPSAALTVVDSELLWEGDTLVLYVLGRCHAALGPLTVDLARRWQLSRVTFESLTDTPQSMNAGSSDTQAKPSGDPQSAAEPPSPAVDGAQQQYELRTQVLQQLIEGPDRFAGQPRYLLQRSGIYPQKRRAAGNVQRELMVRLKLPGGRLTGHQFVQLAQLAQRLAGGTLRLTSRQGLQLHGVAREQLRSLIVELNQQLVTTLGACGRVVRNVMCCPAPPCSADVERQLWRSVRQLATSCLPQAEFYQQIFLDGEVWLDSLHDPLYGTDDLPQKLKLAFGFPECNCVDVEAHDVGLMTIVEDGTLAGFDVYLGGGQSSSQRRPETGPRLARPVGFLPASALPAWLDRLISWFRDTGTRGDARLARLRYQLSEPGSEAWRALLAAWAVDGAWEPLRAPQRPWGCTTHLGWQRLADSGRWNFGWPVPQGRLTASQLALWAQALSAWPAQQLPEVRLTPEHQLLWVGIADDEKTDVEAHLWHHGLIASLADGPNPLVSMACPAFPTCALAVAEAERWLPDWEADLRQLLAEHGLADEPLRVRVSGCGNACVRTYSADLGLIGTAAETYDLVLGGSPADGQLACRWRTGVTQPNLRNTLAELLRAYQRERREQESLSSYLRRLARIHRDNL